MSGSNSAERKRHEPLVLVETADLSEEDWLDYRRRGIGGSDVSAIFGTSPFRTARDQTPTGKQCICGLPVLW